MTRNSQNPNNRRCSATRRSGRGRPTERGPSTSVSRSGTAAIELVVVLPLLLILAMACVDLGRAIHEYQVLENAVQVGTDYAATHQFTPYSQPGWEANIASAVLEEMQNAPNFDTARLTTTTQTFLDVDGRLCVKVRGDYQFLTIVDWPGLPAQIPLRREMTQRQVR
ncbi:MAG: TadE/TadG family type IV pilus assembly protein [Planctomycetaceae bacterium]